VRIPSLLVFAILQAATFPAALNVTEQLSVNRHNSCNDASPSFPGPWPLLPAASRGKQGRRFRRKPELLTVPCVDDARLADVTHVGPGFPWLFIFHSSELELVAERQLVHGTVASAISATLEHRRLEGNSASTSPSRQLWCVSPPSV
jgi:hypothetical protein